MAALKKLADISDAATGRNATGLEVVTAKKSPPSRVARKPTAAPMPSLRVARKVTPTATPERKPTAAPMISTRVDTRAPPRVARAATSTAPPRVEVTVTHNPLRKARTSTSNDAQRLRVEVEAERYQFRSRGFPCAVLETENDESYLLQPAPAVMEMSMTVAVTDPETGSLMEYRDIMKSPKMK